MVNENLFLDNVKVILDRKDLTDTQKSFRIQKLTKIYQNNLKKIYRACNNVARFADKK